MKSKKTLNDLFQNNKFTLVFSFFAAIAIWLVVVVTVSPQSTRVIKNVKVTIDETVPSQFGLVVFGEKEFTVDVTVKGKKYQISNAALSADDISVVAVTKDVDSSGHYTLQLIAEPGTDNTDYTISSLSKKSVKVYFDIEKTKTFVVEPKVITGNFKIAADGFSCGDINLSESTISLTGPSAQIDRVDKVVAQLELSGPLSTNKSAEVPLVVLDDAGNSNFEHLVMSKQNVVVTIPILRIKVVDTVVTFKNAPDALVLNPLKYTINPGTASFEVLVSEYETVTEKIVGSINFNELSPTSNTFTFENLITDGSGKTETFKVRINMSEYSQESIKVPDAKVTEKITGNSSSYKVSGLNKSVIIVGKPEDLANITEDMISVEIDLSSVTLEDGESKKIPVVVSVNSPNCWVYGSYSVTVSR